ncbi:MAG: ribosome-associated translation inhibitor RaiA [Clostridia bacterium]
MKIELFGKNYNITDGLTAMTEKKCVKLEKYIGEDKGATVKFIVTHEAANYTTDMTVITRSLTYRASATSDSPYDNLDEVIPKLIGQISKQKDIWTTTKKSVEPEKEEAIDEE